MGNAGRNICNDYLYTALGDAVESMEYRIPKKCAKDSCPDHIHYKCPSCGKIHMTRYKHGCQNGKIPIYCEYCGQAIQWEKNLEGMKDEKN